ncbi:hypothetical protein [Chryseobacterium sp.]|uniref:hypothetical protein n=1 Tax=Chryseobacterium sp. TaxID=1871047 RepID=UPI0024E24852|nr:hypothetical protein [Chryseobacterium sp.]
MEEPRILNFETLNEAKLYRAENYYSDPSSSFFITFDRQHNQLVKRAVIFVPQDLEANKKFWNYLLPNFIDKYHDDLYKDFADSELCQINYYNIR